LPIAEEDILQIVMGAQSCGFGPVAKLVAVSRLLNGHKRIFIGQTVALDFARANSDAFEEVYDESELTAATVRSLIETSGLAISVMSASLVFQAAEAHRDAVLIDSLFPFWKITTSMSAIEATVDRAVRTSTSVLQALSEHEQVLAAHLLARRSLIQAAEGARERLAIMPARIRESAIITSPIIDEQNLEHARNSDGKAEAQLVINIGGFQNFYLDYKRNNQYLRLIRRWVADLVRDWPEMSPVMVCSGAYGQQASELSHPTAENVSFRLLPQPEFFAAVRNSPYYFLTPGFTAVCEAVALGRLPLALPEQHYGHVFNVRALANTTFGGMACRLADTLPDSPVPEADLPGTRAIAEYAGQIVASEELYAHFRETINKRIDSYVGLSDQQVSAAIKELGAVFSGMRLPAALNLAIDHG
jgi:BarA-like signal transduction histidine kinase